MKEPEEIIESKIVDALASRVSGISIEGALRPFADGAVKELPDTFINVTVDQTEKVSDVRYTSPAVWSAKIAIHVSRADDKNGALFRSICRDVRTALDALEGDGCGALDDAAERFSCSAFSVDSTQTTFDSDIGEDGSMVKVYTASVDGRAIRTPIA